MVANNTMVRLIKRPPLSVVGRRKKGVRPPAPLRNEGSILVS